MFKIIAANYAATAVPQQLSGTYSTWWDAHAAIMQYCVDVSLSPANFWIEDNTL